MGVHRLVEQRGPGLVVVMVITLMNADPARELYAAARTDRRSAVFVTLRSQLKFGS
jgi:hypothetical protein